MDALDAYMAKLLLLFVIGIEFYILGLASNATNQMFSFVSIIACVCTFSTLIYTAPHAPFGGMP